MYLLLSACWIAAWVFVGIKKSPDLQLSESKRKELQAIVGNLIAMDETDDDIQPVVDDFKQKYGTRSWARTVRRIAVSETLAIAFVPPVIGCIALVVLPWVGRGFTTTKH